MSVFSTTLGNGLQLLVQELRTTPVVTVWLWYRVGSLNEHSGITGVSHWLEHMLFKGTERWPGGSAHTAIAREGGTHNGMTWYDFTAYYTTLPSTHLELALGIEADRMLNGSFQPSDVESERNVIISERHGNENSPLFVLGEEVAGAAYRLHPYGHPIIGRLCDLQAMTHEDLLGHYRRFYRPANAILTVAGDVEPMEAAHLAEHYFGQLPAQPAPRALATEEPPQRGERRVEVEGAGGTNYLEIAFHIPEANHAHFHALTILNAVLTGGAGFLVGRGSLTNRTSRLCRALVAQGLAVDVDGDIVPTVDPGLYRLRATVHPGRSVAEAEQALLEAIEQVKVAPISDTELLKAQRQARALFAYASESITHQGFWMGLSSIFADYDWYLHYLQNLEAVTAEAIMEAAQTYLESSNRVTGCYLGTSA